MCLRLSRECTEVPGFVSCGGLASCRRLLSVLRDAHKASLASATTSGFRGVAENDEI